MGDSRQVFASAERFIITDVGSTTTKAILFRHSGKERQFFYEESPTTVEKPTEDVTVGVLRAAQALESVSGEVLLAEGRPVVPYLSTSCAGRWRIGSCSTR